MLFGVKFLAFYLLSTVLVSCAVVELHPKAVTPSPPADNVTSSSTPAPQKTSDLANKTDLRTSNSSNHAESKVSVVNITKSDAQGVKASLNQPATTNSSAAVKNITLPAVTTSTTPVASHHKNTHPTDSSHLPPHPPVVIPVNPMPDNVLQDMTHPAQRPLRATEKFNPTFSAIVAAICITTAVGGYVILMAWRKMDMDRYGNRQMLINEDDFGDIQDEDMRHFEASCIQIET